MGAYVYTMHYTPLVEKALRTTAHLHDGQHRKGDLLPFMSHVFSVALILTDYVDDDAIICSALLHDTVEDTLYTFAELENDFGARITAIVRGVTIVETGEPLNWMARHEQYIRTLSHAVPESSYVSAADKIHNMRSIMLWYKGVDDKNFHRDFGGTNAERIMVYTTIRDIVARADISPELLTLYDDTFSEYKEFLTR